MNKLNVLVIIGVILTTSMVKASGPDYVVTGEDIKFYEKVRYGITASLVGVDQSGRVRYHADDVVAYRKNGQIYERMPVISNNKETGRYAFMELVAYRNGLKVFRNTTNEGTGIRHDEYLVYRDGSYVVSFDEKNSPTLNVFFFSRDRFGNSN